MKSFNNILVALDLSHIDKDLIKYASFIAEKLKISKVYFVHNIKKYEISEIFEEQLKNIDLDKMITEEIEEMVAQNFTAEVETKILISEDPYTESLINYIAHKYHIDLVVMGNKNDKSGTGVIPDKLMRILKCDILSVPENPQYNLKEVWVGTDFSRESKKCFQLTELFQRELGSKITAAHIYNVPIQFAPYLDKEDVVPKIEKHTQKKFEKFLTGTSGQDITTRIIRGREASVSDRLYKEANKANASLLVVSDKGGNVFSSLLVGSVTDELFSSQLQVPLWIVK